jgi:uncharacterized RDD family membrane protein YckC
VASDPANADEGDAPSDRILTLDNVPLDLPVAGAGTRTLAGTIDYLVVWILVIATLLGGFYLASLLDLKSPWWLAALVFALFFTEYGYFAISEIWMDGRTLGKNAVGLRVVARDGSRPSNAALLLRNAVRTIDLAIGVPLMTFDPLSRRLGDRLAGTLVVRTRVRPTTMLRRIPEGFGPRQIALLEEFLVRCDELEPQKADQLAQSLLALIASRDPGFLPAAAVSLSPVQRLKNSVTDGAR